VTQPTFPNEPLSQIVWHRAEDLDANDYNPNIVMNAELKLLERSLLATGWVQPILVSAPEHIIIDGFHRRMLAMTSKALLERYKGWVPCAELPISRAAAMLMTIRMNRAKGSHVAVRMASIVKELIDTHHLAPKDIAVEMGAPLQEIQTLYQDDIFKARDLKNYAYSKAWVPAVRVGPPKTEEEIEDDAPQTAG
jgi:ParB-like chromosome segregation protein Spo0J